MCGECPNYNNDNDNDNDDGNDGNVMRGCMFALVPSLILWLVIILAIASTWRTYAQPAGGAGISSHHAPVK